MEADHSLRLFSLQAAFLSLRVSRIRLGRTPKSFGTPKRVPIETCNYRPWKDDVVAFRHELVEISEDWVVLGFFGSCRFALPSAEDMALHRKEYRYFEPAQNLKRDLSSLLDVVSDGWVRPEDWEAVKVGNKAIFEGILEAVLTNKDPDGNEPIRGEGDLRDIWPFDLPE